MPTASTLSPRKTLPFCWGRIIFAVSVLRRRRQVKAGGLSYPITPQPVGVVTIYPAAADVVRNFLRQPVADLTPALWRRQYQNGEFIQICWRKPSASAVLLVVNLTQCMSGKVNMGGYATRQRPRQAGVISGFDMTGGSDADQATLSA